ncbi:hypothetical protein FQN60_000837, partial [Etheostoma spectabile]
METGQEDCTWTDCRRRGSRGEPSLDTDTVVVQTLDTGSTVPQYQDGQSCQDDDTQQVVQRCNPEQD